MTGSRHDKKLHLGYSDTGYHLATHCEAVTQTNMFVSCLMQVEVEFELEDVNDFSPIFRPSDSYTFSVSEVR